MPCQKRETMESSINEGSGYLIFLSDFFGIVVYSFRLRKLITQERNQKVSSLFYGNGWGSQDLPPILISSASDVFPSPDSTPRNRFHYSYSDN